MRLIWDFLWSPIVFFEKRLAEPPDWWLAASGLVVCIFLQAISASMLIRVWGDAQAELARSFGADPGAVPPAGIFLFFSAFSYPITFGMAVVALLSMNVLYRDTGQAARLIECTGLCFFTQVPFLLFLIPVAASADPPPLRIASSVRGVDLMHALEAYRDGLFSAPVRATHEVFAYYSTGWLITQLACVLRAAAGFSIRASIIAGAFFFVLFFGFSMGVQWLT